MKPGHSAKRFLFVLAALLVLLVLALALVNHLGWREWDQCRRELEAKGESLDWRKFVPPPVPDEQNFAMTPLLAPLFDFVTEEGHLFPRDTNAVARAEHLFDGVGYLGGAWWRGKFADFNKWQNLLRGFSNEPAVTAWINESRLASWVIADTNRSYVDEETGPAAMHPTASAEVSDRRPVREWMGEASAVVAAWQAKPPAASAAADLLALIRLNSAEIEELRAALKRPGARFDIRYEHDPEFRRLPHLGVLKKYARAFQDQALAELADGDATHALDDVLTGLAIGDTVKDEPLLLSGLDRIAIFSMAIQPVWEGLARRQWSSNQIALLQFRLEKINLVQDMVHALRGERAIDVKSIDTVLHRSLAESNLLFRICIAGWVYRNQATFAKVYQDHVLPPFDPTNRTVDLPLSIELAEAISRQRVDEMTLFSDSLFASMISADAKQGGKIAQAQATLHQAATACALERYRLAHGAYPERLEQLSPEFLPRGLCDPVNGQPLKYRRTGADQFVLYSVGRNGVDDGGQYVLDNKYGNMITKKSDWVWGYPSNAAAGPHE